MELQVALDRIPLGSAVTIAREVAPFADWVEVGTSLVKRDGMSAVIVVAAAASPTPVLADLKTIDDAETEFTLAFDAGASAVTVAGVAPPDTRKLAVRVATERHCELMIDLIGLTQSQIAHVAGDAPADVVLEAHLGKDAQSSHGGVAALLGHWATGRRVAVAGGMTVRDLDAVRQFPDLRIIAGSAVTKADEPAQAAREFRQAMNEMDKDKVGQRWTAQPTR